MTRGARAVQSASTFFYHRAAMIAAAAVAEGGIETLVASLAAAGVEIVTPVSEAPGGWSAELRDPDGHMISFFQDAALPKTG